MGANIDHNGIAVSPFHHQIEIAGCLIPAVDGFGDRAMVAAKLVSLQVVAAQQVGTLSIFHLMQ